MGFLSRLLGSSRGKAQAEDNFELIALNMAMFRHALETEHANRFPKQEALFVACGVLDALSHIGNGHFTVQDVVDAMRPAKHGRCELGLIASVSIEDEMQAFYRGPTNLFLNYTLQIEAMIFDAIETHVEASGMSQRDILMAVLREKERIARILDTPGAELAHSQQMEVVRRAADAFMTSDEFADCRHTIGIEK